MALNLPTHSEDGHELAEPPAWLEGQVRPKEFKPAQPAPLPPDAVRVAMLRVAGVDDTLVLADALNMTPQEVCGHEALPGFTQAMKAIRMAAGLGSWRAKIESTVATGFLPSGTVASEGTQARFMSELFEREEPKKQIVEGGNDGATTIVLTGEAMQRILGGLKEAERDVIDITPRTVAPAQDVELEKQRKLYEQDRKG